MYRHKIAELALTGNSKARNPAPNGQADANNAHGFAIFMGLVGALHSLRSFRRRLPWTFGRVNLSPYQYRVTKYNPRFRDGRGAYTKDDWTAISDIGKSFSGVVLTEEEYHRVERAHLLTAQAFLQEAGVVRLQAIGVENHRSHPEAPKEGQWLEIEAGLRTLRHVLRENFWCRLEEGASTFLGNPPDKPKAPEVEFSMKEVLREEVEIY